MRFHFRGWQAAALLLFSGTCAAGKSPSVPANFRELYTSLDQKLNAFDHTVSSQWNGQKAPVVWSTELLIANCNRGLSLLRPQVYRSTLRELDRLQGIGVKGVTLCIGFPILYRPFYDFNGDPQDYPRMLSFYRKLAAEIHGLGLKMIVESSILFPGIYSVNSGFKLAEYYRTLHGREWVDGRTQNFVTIAKEVHPDFLNLGSEPDTQAFLSSQPVFNTPDGYAGIIRDFLERLHKVGAADIPIGAGIGTWQRDGRAFVKGLLATGINYLDLHIYAVNRDYLENAITYADMAHAAGKQVAISEAWLMKIRDQELGHMHAATDLTIFSRDVYRFWAPLDQKFLGALVKYANWKHLLYCSPYWSRYFWSYVPYDQIRNPANAKETVRQAGWKAMHAMVFHQLTPTGRFYSEAIRGKVTR